MSIRSATVKEETRARLIKQLYGQSLHTILAGQAVGFALAFAMYGEIREIHLWIWISALSLVTLTRLISVRNWHLQGKSAQNVTVWIRKYQLGALAAGIVWASIIAFFTATLSFYHQLLLITLLVGIPVASMATNAILLPVFYAFCIPILLSLLYWALFLVPELDLFFSLASLVYGITILLTGHAYNRYLLQSLETGLKNELLIEDLSQANQKLEGMAYFDSLTGLANRRWFQEEAEKTLVRCKRNGTQMALMLIDLDNFKEVNDKFGHEAGDELLRSVAKRLNESLRQSDILVRRISGAARFGGDEFTVLLEDIDGELGAESAAERVLEMICAPVPISDGDLAVTASVGVAIFPQHAEKLSTLIRSADIAMYQAKQRGRNQYRLFEAVA